jgi:transcriptional regulator with XRE-family HTH domain
MDEKADQETSIFEELKQFRIKKNLDLEKIAEKTKININYLKAIESGNIDEIPEVYDKLFFQTYVTYLKIKNPDHYLDEYRKIRKAELPQNTTTIQKIKSIKADEKKFNKLKQLYVIIPLIVVIIIIIILAMNSKSVETNGNKEIKELSVRDIVQEIEKKNAPSDDSLTQSTENIIDKNNVAVEIATLELTWLRYVKDKIDTVEYLLKNGDNISVNAESSLVFLVGNAGGVSFNINGKNEGVLGTSNDVISFLKVTPDGIAAKQLKTIVKRDTINDSLNIN